MDLTKEEQAILRDINALFVQDEYSRAILSGFAITLAGAVINNNRKEFSSKMIEIAEYMENLKDIGTPPTNTIQ